MAAGSLLALLDDITTILDDVAVMTKVAAKKTAGVLGDDLALNAHQVSGIDASRELPVVWAVAKGSFVNKLILVPAALAISYIAPKLMLFLLMIGGAYLCFEGFEKLAHKFLHKPEQEGKQEEITHENPNNDIELVALEKEKIKGAIRTDFVLSAEIIVIALGTVADKSFSQQAMVVTLIAIVMTVGVYGLVAGIVKIDDLGLHLLATKGRSYYKQFLRKIGSGLLYFAPLLMRTLTVLGTIAMFVVGGSIISHGFPAVHHWKESLASSFSSPSMLDSVLTSLTPILTDTMIGIITGAICVAFFALGTKLINKFKAH